jgi:hypothetical protein
MGQNVELIAATIRLMLEGKGAQVYPTYPPTDSSAFGANVGTDYIRYICLTQRILHPAVNQNYYLFYRNKLTRNSELPEFSSVEFGYFSKQPGVGNVFTTIFKHHKINKHTNMEIDDKTFISEVVQKIIGEDKDV